MKLRQKPRPGEPTRPCRSGSTEPVPPIPRRKSHAPQRSDRRNQSSATTSLVRDAKTRRKANTWRDLAAPPIPNSGRNPNQNPNADSNLNLEEVEIWKGTQTVSSRTQTRPRKPCKHWQGRVGSGVGEWAPIGNRALVLEGYQFL